LPLTNNGVYSKHYKGYGLGSVVKWYVVVYLLFCGIDF